MDPDHTVVGVVSGPQRRTASELSATAARVAAGLRRLGVGPGDTVALLMRNDLAFLEATFGIMRLGAYPVPVNWHFKVDEVAYILEDCGAKVLIAHADLLPAVRSALGGLALIAVATPPEVAEAYGVAPAARSVAPGDVDWEPWLAGQADEGFSPVRAPDSMIYTSGTTGHPKGVRRLTPTAEQAEGLDAFRRQLFGLAPGSRSLVTGPLYHSAPNNFAVQAVKASELTVLMPRFEPEAMLALVDRYRITTMFMVPTMFVRLLKLPEETRRRYDVSSLRFVVHSAAPCPPDVKRAMIALWGPVLYEFFGSSETGPVAFADSEEWLSHPGTVGRLLPGARVAVVDDQGGLAPRGQPGELFVKQRFSPEFTYHRLPEKRTEVERDGLVTCGDVGYLDADDFLYLCDRKRDMVISGGVNIYPAEIEGVLITCPGVKDCAVIGVPDAEFGETLLAIVEPVEAGALDAGAVKTFLQSRIAGFKVPRAIEFATDLPREDSGKIFKRRLRERYWAGSGRAI